MKLHISPSVGLPLDAVTQTFAILAKRRVGKTYTASVMAEEMVKAGLPFVALDPTGAWWGLRASANGKSEGLPVTIIGGSHGDIPLEPTAGKVIAELVVDNPGFYIIDLSGTASNAEQDRFAADFAERLYRYKDQHRDPLHLFVDEADSFAPQRPLDGQQRMLGAFEALIRRGGIRGLGMTMITQRPAVLNKNVLTQAEVLIVLQMTAPQDQDAVDAWIQRNGTKEERDTMMASLASLKRGQAWIWSPAWLEMFELVQIRERTTFNSSATPKAGEKVVAPRKLARVDIEALKTRISETIERAKSDDPRELRRQISELKKQTKPTIEIQRIEVPSIPEDILLELKEVFDGIQNTIQVLRNYENRLSTLLQRARKLKAIAPSSPKISQPIEQWHATYLPLKSKPVKDIQSEDTSIPTGARRMLQVLAQRHPVKLTRAQLGTLAGFTPSGGTYSNYFSLLKRGAFITEASNGDIEITSRGIVYLGVDVPPSPTTTAETIEMWKERLPAGASKMLDILVDSYPHSITREELGERSGFKASGGTFSNYLSVLRRNTLVEISGQYLKASDNLFEI
jgi:uncharacterized protein